MSDYKNIIGKPIKSISSNLDNDQAEGQIWYNTTDQQFKNVIVRSAWASSSPVVSGRNQTAAAGTQDASILFGGKEGPPPNADTGTTQEYNGSGWAFGGTMTDARYELGGAGTQTAGLAFGGIDGGSNTDATEEYDGSSWTNGGALTQATYEQGGAGTQTAALAFGGQRQPSIMENNTQKYDGSSWTNTGNLNQARRFIMGFGIQTAAVAAGGTSPPAPNTNATEEFDGSSWTTVNSMNSGRRNGGSSGILTAGLVYGGADSSPSNKTEQYDGTTWSVESTLGTARYNHYGAGTNDTGAIYAAGGPPSGLSIAEEYTKSANVITAAAWSSGGLMGAGRYQGNGQNVGTKDAGMYAGGRGSFPATQPAVTVSSVEEYDGSSWSEVNNMPTSLDMFGSVGTQTAAFVFGGMGGPGAGPNPAPGGSSKDGTFNYDGTNWTSETALPAATQNLTGAGTQTAVVSIGGNPALTTCNEYDGSSWTSTGSMTTGRRNGSAFGLQTAAIIAGGNPGSAVAEDVESYNGSSWTSASDLIQPKAQAGTAGTQTDGLIFAGNEPSPTTALGWNGTSWFTQPSISTARYGGTNGSTSVASAYYAGGGGSASGTQRQTTEEFTSETTALNIKTITTS